MLRLHVWKDAAPKFALWPLEEEMPVAAAAGWDNCPTEYRRSRRRNIKGGEGVTVFQGQQKAARLRDIPI